VHDREVRDDTKAAWHIEDSRAIPAIGREAAAAIAMLETVSGWLPPL
jgi:hypothetical protein